MTDAHPPRAPMKHRIILDLCGGTGSWSKPYQEAGYDVRVITWPKDDVRYYVPENIQVHGILAAPPCTMFSLARTTAKTPRNTRAGMETVEACLRIIWECFHIGKPAWWAMENPRGLLRRFLGRPAMSFEQWEYGDAGIKPTDLWGDFAIPRKTVTEKPVGLTKRFPNGRTNAVGWAGAGAEKRSITPPGFARAFFEANP